MMSFKKKAELLLLIILIVALIAAIRMGSFLRMGSLEKGYGVTRSISDIKKGLWKRTILSSEISLNVNALFLGNYVISPDNNWLIFLPNRYTPMSIISINLGTGKQMPTTGYNDPFEGVKDFKWTIFWKSENEAILRKNWRYEVSYNNWKNEVYYYELIIHGPEVIVNKLHNVPDKSIKFVDIYSKKNAFEFFSNSSTIDMNDLASRHPEIAFKKTWFNNLEFYYDDILVDKHKKTFNLPSQKPSFRGLSISPDNKYIFYNISWSSGGWSHGQSHLYLLDIKKRNVTLIDTIYNSSGEELMVWTMDSKKFIYRIYYGVVIMKKTILDN